VPATTTKQEPEKQKHASGVKSFAALVVVFVWLADEVMRFQASVESSSWEAIGGIHFPPDGLQRAQQ
jgi:hypothetical protein